MEVSFFAHAKALTRLVANDTAGLIAIEASRASYEIWHIEGKKALAIETARISLGQHKGLTDISFCIDVTEVGSCVETVITAGAKHELT